MFSHIYFFCVVSLHSWHFSRKDRIRSNKYVCVVLYDMIVCVWYLFVHVQGGSLRLNFTSRKVWAWKLLQRSEKISDTSKEAFWNQFESNLKPFRTSKIHVQTTRNTNHLSNINPWKSAFWTSFEGLFRNLWNSNPSSSSLRLMGGQPKWDG